MRIELLNARSKIWRQPLTAHETLGISWISILIYDVLTLDLITVCNLLQTRDGLVYRVHPPPPTFC